MKVLIVEDNKTLAESIKTLLHKHYLVDVVYGGADALEQVALVDYDAIVLDLGLPDISGHTVCKTMRTRGVTSPILVLSAVVDVAARVQLLDSGADDYLTKPFHGTELVSRLRALVRRAGRYSSSNAIVVDDLELDIDRREVRRGGKTIPLRNKEFEILRYLLNKRGRAVSREMILNHVWQSEKSAWRGTVDVHIKYLRDKIDRPFKTSIIKTAYGVGYMVEGASQLKVLEERQSV